MNACQDVEHGAESDDAGLVRRIRKACASEFDLPITYPFFYIDALGGESPDETILRLFHQEQDASGGTEREVIAAMVRG